MIFGILFVVGLVYYIYRANKARPEKPHRYWFFWWNDHDN